MSGDIRSIGRDTYAYSVLDNDVSPSALPIALDFTECPSASAIGCWLTYSAKSSKNWECSGNNRGASGEAGDSGFEINNFGADDASDDWFITPPMSITQDSFFIRFDAMYNFSGSTVKVLASKDYLGAGDPSAATWTELPQLSSVWNPTAKSYNYYPSGELKIEALLQAQPWPILKARSISPFTIPVWAAVAARPDTSE
ncbi:MAG: hypothetical protein HC842_03500 [Cytophagales bacterium]|nr:hypothetical protein [Cytophagales bacterium]